MSEIKISYQDAAIRYPEVVDVVMSKLRRGTRRLSKSNLDRLRYQNTKPERLKWSLVWSHKPAQMLDNDEKNLAERTLEEEVARQLSLIKMPTLRAVIGEWTGDAILGIAHGVPDEILSKVASDIEFRHTSAVRWAAMTPEEKKVEQVATALSKELTKKKNDEIRRKARAIFGKLFKDLGLETAALDLEDPAELLTDLQEELTEFMSEYAKGWKE